MTRSTVASMARLGNSSSSTNLRRFWPVGIGICLVGSALRAAIGPLLIDDAYIYFRYALNAASGNGLVYNPGQLVFGATSPPYTLVLALFAKAGLDLVRGSIIFGITLDFVSAILMLAIGRRLGTDLTGWLAALIFSLAPKSVIPGLSGMETSLFTLLVILALTCLIYQRSSAAIIFAGLAGATRPEGLALLGVVVTYLALKERRLRWRATLLATMPTLLWLAASRLLYHEWIPNSISAKAAVFPPYANPFHDSILVVRYLTNPLEFTSTVPQLTWVNLVFLCIEGIGLVIVVRRSKAMLAFLAWAAIIGGSYALINRSMFPWYLGPFFPLVSIFLAVAVGGSVESEWTTARPRRLSPNTTGAFNASILLILALAFSLTSGSSGEFVRADQNHREAAYLRLGRWFATHLPHDDTIGSAEIGAVGYGYPGPILDFTGLVSPEVLPYFAARDFVFHYPDTLPADAVARFAPPVLVTYDKFITDISQTSWFKQIYPNSRVVEMNHPVYGTLMVFTARGIPIPPPGVASGGHAWVDPDMQGGAAIGGGHGCVCRLSDPTEG
jgi:hypothetical protein